MNLSLILSVLAFPGLLVVALAPYRGPSQAVLSELHAQMIKYYEYMRTQFGIVEPHIYSIKKNYELCDFYSDSPVSLFYSKGFSVNGSFPRITGDTSGELLFLYLFPLINILSIP